MPKPLIQYRVFIGSPNGLAVERECFRRTLEKFTAMHGEPRGATFHPVCWEETVGGVGRPQDLINDDLRQCDYAVFVFHDRWGSTPGNGFTSGTEEEWALAEKLYTDNKIRNIALFFKQVDPRQLRDPGKQLEMVLAFKKRIEETKRYHFRQYDTTEQFADDLERYLARWQRDHDSTASRPSLGTATAPAPAAFAMPSPSFVYWIIEANKQSEKDVPNYAAVLFCTEKAIAAAESDIEWAKGKNVSGRTLIHLGRPGEAICAFIAVAERFEACTDVERRGWHARALVNKGVALGALDRREEEIAVYDGVVARFGTGSELTLREQVATALFNKGPALGVLDRGEEEIAVYDDVVARFGMATELPLREQVAKARTLKDQPGTGSRP
jgi:hypothetical protein